MERGYSLWFEEDGMGGYLTPAGDFSTLVENMDGSFTLTMKDGFECHFSSAGRLTSCVDRNDNTIEYAYSSASYSITDVSRAQLTHAITDPADGTLLARTLRHTDPDESDRIGLMTCWSIRASSSGPSCTTPPAASSR